MAAPIPVPEESLQCMILFPTLTPAASQRHLNLKFTFTSRRRPAPPLLLKLFLKSSQPRQTGLQSDWKTPERSVLSGVQMSLRTPGKHGWKLFTGKRATLTPTKHHQHQAAGLKLNAHQNHAAVQRGFAHDNLDFNA